MDFILGYIENHQIEANTTGILKGKEFERYIKKVKQSYELKDKKET